MPPLLLEPERRSDGMLGNWLIQFELLEYTKRLVHRDYSDMSERLQPQHMFVARDNNLSLSISRRAKATVVRIVEDMNL